MTTPWTRRYAQRMQWMGSSIIRQLLKFTEQPDIISFAGGLPAPELFPVRAFEEATKKVLAEYGSQALQYSTTEGYLPLRELIVERMGRYGIPARPENVLLTSGSQQALDLIGKLLINPGDLILTEEPSYLGAIQAWRAYQAEFVTVPIDDHGLCCADLLEEALCAGPKFMYVLPNFHNPAGVTLSGERRQRIIRIADEYGIPIVEDDPYGQLRFEGEHLPPLLVLDARQLNGGGENGHGEGKGTFLHGNVIYLSTFSKTLAPGLRLGWMVAPEEVIQKCVMAKQGMDLHTSTLVQMVTYEVARDGFLDKHVASLRRVYRRRRDLMLETMARYFPPDVRWTRPEGGLFLWATLPGGMDSTELLKDAIEHKVAYVPGTAFFPAGGGHNTLRLNFSNARPEMIEEGIRRLGDVFTAALERGERKAEPAPA